MKKNLLKILLLICLSKAAVTNAQNILWEKSMGGKYADYLTDAKPTADYGFILAGSSLSNKTGNKTSDNKGDLDYWVWKMNEKGDLEWQKSFGGSGADFLQSIVLTRDAGFILAGTSASNKGFDKTEDARGQDDIWIIKLNAKGSQEWQKTIGGFGQEKVQSIYQTQDGGYIIGGSSSSDESGEKTTDSFGNMDYWVIKLTTDGKIEWQKTFGGIYNDELRSIEQTLDGGYILGGYSNSPISGNKTEDNKGTGDFWVLKLKSNGDLKWQKTIGGEQDDQLYVVHQTYDGNYVVGGNSNSSTSENKTKTNTEGTDFWVLKLNEASDILWQQTYNFGKTDVLTSLVENQDHTLLLGGYAQSEIQNTSTTSNTNLSEKRQPKDTEGINDYIALKVSETGEVLWSKTVGSGGEDLLRKVIETRDGGYLLAGTSNAFPSTINSSTFPSGGVPEGRGGNAINQTKNNLNTTITETTNDINKEINDTAKSITQKTKDVLGIPENAPIKVGDSFLKGDLTPSPSPKERGASSTNNNYDKPLPASRDKAKNLGGNDFWVVKLKDESKLDTVKKQIEAFPNPTPAFTNIIVGYEFESGTATLVDLAGRVLEQVDITTRTVPIDLSPYPDGIYIVNIKTNKQSDGVKIIKENKK